MCLRRLPRSRCSRSVQLTAGEAAGGASENHREGASAAVTDLRPGNDADRRSDETASGAACDLAIRSLAAGQDERGGSYSYDVVEDWPTWHG